MHETGEFDSDFHQFVVQRSPALSRAAFLLAGDHQLAEDLLQAALARTYRHWQRIHGDQPEAYVRRVMYHQHISWWRRKRVTEHLMATPPERSGDDPSGATELRVAVAAALQQLTPRQRAVVVLRYYDDLTEAQVADLLGCSIGTVKRHGHDALRRLRVIAPELVDAPRERSAR
ncbi:MAG TPA: SigE family RNA polymerase sigma factor [Micromonospora sp.]|nr:SigE family RNA polymerase sigma factor [Micromonospora sp.]